MQGLDVYFIWQKHVDMFWGYLFEVGHVERVK
jgi:hypothetical protein